MRASRRRKPPANTVPALDLYESVALRLELARHLEREGAPQAPTPGTRPCSLQPDAFEGMRRTGGDPLAVAQDLISATFYTDGLETLQGISDPKALPFALRRTPAMDNTRRRKLLSGPGCS